MKRIGKKFWRSPVCYQSLLATVLSAFIGGSLAPLMAQEIPQCRSALSDPDGDGFGWENRRSCRVAAAGRPAIPPCTRPDSDPDGDGFGWENNRSCAVGGQSGQQPTSAQRPTCSSAAADPDGDGYGWENNQSCNVDRAGPAQALAEEKITIRFPACSSSRYDPDADGYGWENSTTCSSRNTGDSGRSITDLVLVTGQSNALGAETSILKTDSFDADLDSPVQRVYVYAQTGWTVASLQQIWDLGWYPRADISEKPANNFAFHFAKSVVRQDPNRVVGFVLATAPGQPIAHWDKTQSFYNEIKNKVSGALDALPHKSRVDAVLWHQGETDYYDSEYYGTKLRQLIGNLRSEVWMASNAVFICGETLNAPVNRRLNGLNTDSDARTACVQAADLESVGDDLHFSANSLRILGSRYADKYLEILGF